jgi:glucosamine-6-phosphate deaminase
MIHLKIVPDYLTLSEKAAQFVLQQIRKKPDSVLALPTGKTPLGMYQKLIEFYKERRISFARVKTFNLDEYVGIPKTDPLSYHFYMQENFFRHIDIPPNQTFIPDGMAQDLHKECEDYEKKIQKFGPIDLAILGIGCNGHIGFNEPGTDPNLPTHQVQLSPETVKINQGPKQAITMGIKTILQAKKILLLASGENKAKALQKMFEKPDPSCPASFLQTHPAVWAIIDQKAASLLD